MFCSIIVPCWNEEAGLERCLRAARTAIPRCEIIAAVAQSADATERVANDYADRTIRCARRQRAAQMNEGAAKANGAILVFLHADTLLPPGAGRSLEEAIERKGAVGGGFARRFDSSSPLLAVTCLLAEARCRAFGWFLGDQAIFVRRGVFRGLGGFREMDRFEDLDFARRLRRIGKVATLRPRVVSSARRFEREGAARRTWRDFVLTLCYLRGDPAASTGPMPLKPCAPH